MTRRNRRDRALRIIRLRQIMSLLVLGLAVLTYATIRTVNRRIAARVVRWMDEGEARKTVARYAAARAIDVHHRPLAPWISTLAPPEPWIAPWMTAGALLLSLALVGLIDD